MKNIYALLVITLLGLVLYSCKKDSSTKNSDGSVNIVREWRIDYRIYDYYANGKVLDTFTRKYDTSNPEYVIFYKDGTGVFKESGAISTKFNFSVTATTINLTSASRFNNGAWFPLNDFQYKIITSNANELYYSTEGPVASPSSYDKVITSIHLVK
jgi:hypothetical protein